MARRNRSTLLRTTCVQHRRHGVARRIVIISDDTRAMGRRVRCGNIPLEIRENTETHRKLTGRDKITCRICVRIYT
jgi:hypothetical protein